MANKLEIAKKLAAALRTPKTAVPTVNSSLFHPLNVSQQSLAIKQQQSLALKDSENDKNLPRLGIYKNKAFFETIHVPGKYSSWVDEHFTDAEKFPEFIEPKEIPKKRPLPAKPKSENPRRETRLSHGVKEALMDVFQSDVNKLLPAEIIVHTIESSNRGNAFRVRWSFPPSIESSYNKLKQKNDWKLCQTWLEENEGLLRSLVTGKLHKGKLIPSLLFVFDNSRALVTDSIWDAIEKEVEKLEKSET